MKNIIIMLKDNMQTIFNSKDLQEGNIYSILNLTKSLVKSTDNFTKYMHLKISSLGSITPQTEINSPRLHEISVSRYDTNFALPEINSSRKSERSSNTYREYNLKTLFKQDRKLDDNLRNFTTLNLFKKKRLSNEDNKKNNNIRNLAVIDIKKKAVFHSIFDSYINNVVLSKYFINNSLDIKFEKYLEKIRKFENSSQFHPNIINKKIYKNEKYEIDVNLKSLCIVFEEKSKSSNSYNSSVLYIPIIYIPLIYFLEQEELQKILTFCVYIDDDKEEKLKFNSESFIFLVKSLVNSKTTVKKHKENFKYDWVTYNKTYEVIINMPNAEISFKDFNIIKILEKIVLDTILENDFEEWEYYVLNYFSSIKKFRNLFNKCYSKNVNQNQDNNERNYYLDEYTNTRYYSQDSKFYSFALSKNKGCNLYVTIYWYKLECKSFILSKSGEQSLNLKHSKIINNVKDKFSDINVFFRKFVNMDKMIIDESVFDDFDQNLFIENEKRYNNEIKIVSLKNQNREHFLKTRFKRPIFITYTYTGKDIQSETDYINQELLKKIFNNDIENWKYTIFKFKEDLAERKQLIEEKVTKQNNFKVRLSIKLDDRTRLLRDIGKRRIPIDTLNKNISILTPNKKVSKDKI